MLDLPGHPHTCEVGRCSRAMLLCCVKLEVAFVPHRAKCLYRGKNGIFLEVVDSIREALDVHQIRQSEKDSKFGLTEKKSSQDFFYFLFQIFHFVLLSLFFNYEGNLESMPVVDIHAVQCDAFTLHLKFPS